MWCFRWWLLLLYDVVAPLSNHCELQSKYLQILFFIFLWGAFRDEPPTERVKKEKNEGSAEKKIYRNKLSVTQQFEQESFWTREKILYCIHTISIWCHSNNVIIIKKCCENKKSSLALFGCVSEEERESEMVLYISTLGKGMLLMPPCIHAVLVSVQLRKTRLRLISAKKKVWKKAQFALNEKMNDGFIWVRGWRWRKWRVSLSANHNNSPIPKKTCPCPMEYTTWY